MPVPPRFLTRRPTALTIALISLACAWSGDTRAQETDRPLGVLILGDQQRQGPVPTVRSSLPDDAFPDATAPAARPSSAASARPLGRLLSEPSATPAAPGSVLPEGWSRQGVPAGQPQQGTAAAPAPSRSADSVRPLGSLFNAPPPAQAPATRSASAAPVQTPAIRPAARVQTAPARDADAARPLGTLYGTTATPAPSSDRPQAPIVAPTASQAQPVSSEPSGPGIPARLSADAMTYDRDLGVITASGNVDIMYDGRTLLADKVVYNQKTDVVLAEGNVSLTDQQGQTLFGEKMKITGDLKDGVIFNIGLVLADKARVAGNGARFSNGRTTDVSKAVYTPCDVCADDPDAAPLWQLKAVRVIHDSKEKRVEYRDAWLEIFGVPVAYTPYISHPDPTVKRRSGFLAPSFSNSSELGFRLETPYYWNIDEYQDATFSPLLTTDAGKGAIGEYRRNFKKGMINVNGSFVADDPDRDLRGYIDFESEYHFNRTWRGGLNIETASDDTYNRRYGFSSDPVLVSRGYVEGFRGQNYQVLNTYAFDDLRAESALDDTPVILPMYDFNYVGKRDDLGGFSSFDFNVLNLLRSDGTDTRRIAFRPHWERPFSGYFGEIYSASVSLAADAYHASDVTRDDGSEYSGVSGRLVPRGALTWRLPLIRQSETFSQTIEPQASFAVAPNGGNPDKIPNEDSQEIEFDETNLFAENRYDGFDRIDSGTRFNYGVKWSANEYQGGNASVFLGQSYRPRVDSSFAQYSGIEDNFSDYVARVVINPKDYLQLVYRSQFSPDDLSPQRNELSTSVGGEALLLNANYIFIDQQEGSEYAGREEISGSIASKINRHWSTSFASRLDLASSEFRSLGLQLVYEDECVRFTTQATRSFFEDRDLKPADTISFTLVLKTLGEVRSGVSQ